MSSEIKNLEICVHKDCTVYNDIDKIRNDSPEKFYVHKCGPIILHNFSLDVNIVLAVCSWYMHKMCLCLHLLVSPWLVGQLQYQVASAVV